MVKTLVSSRVAHGLSTGLDKDDQWDSSNGMIFFNSNLNRFKSEE